MHEMSIMTRVLNLALDKLKEEKLEKIISITLVVGEMQDYEEKWLQHYFSYLTPDTPADGARLVVEKLPIRFKCKDCGHEFTYDPHGTDDCSCPACKGFSYDMISGREFFVKNMEAC